MRLKKRLMASCGALPGASVVEILGPESVSVLFSSDAETAFSTTHEARVREGITAWPLDRATQYDLLDSPMLFKSDHGLVLALVHDTVPVEVAGVERVLQDAIGCADSKWFATHALTLRSQVMPLVPCREAEILGGVASGKRKIKKTFDDVEMLWIANDCVI